MGTLFHQSVRKNFITTLDELNNEIQDFIKDTGHTTENAIKLLEIAELRRRNDLYQANGDAWDEQIAGICTILHDINNSFRSISSNLYDMKD